MLLCERLNWKNVVLVVSDDNPLWNEVATMIQAISPSYGINILSEIIFPSFDGVDPLKDYKRMIDQIAFSQGRLIYVVAEPQPTLEFILAAQYYGLSRKKYTYAAFNDLNIPDTIELVDYWAQHGIELNLPARKGIIVFNIAIDKPKESQWTSEKFLPALDFMKQGPFFEVDVNRTGNDPNLYYPEGLYDGPFSSIPDFRVLSSFEAIQRFMNAWKHVIHIDLDPSFEWDP